MGEYQPANDGMDLIVNNVGEDVIYDNHIDGEEHDKKYDDIIEELKEAVVLDNEPKAKSIMNYLDSIHVEQRRVFNDIKPIQMAVNNYSWCCLEYFISLRLKHCDRLDSFVSTADNRNKEPEKIKEKYFFHLLARRPGPEAIALLKRLKNPFSAELFDEEDENGVTPLELALQRRNTDAANYLVSRGADIQSRVGCTGSPLTTAIVTGQLDVLKQMGETMGKESFVEIFSNGYFLGMYGNGHTVFYGAAKSGNDSVFIYLTEVVEETIKHDWYKKELNYILNNVKDIDCGEFLKRIIVSGMIGAFQELENIEKGLLQKALASLKIKPLMWAIEGGHMGIIEAISGYSIGTAEKVIDQEGRNVLHYAAEYGNVEILNHLKGKMSLDALLTAKDKNGCAPFHYAAKKGLFENVRWFLDQNVETTEHSIFHCKPCIEVTEENILKYTFEAIIAKDEKQLDAFHKSWSSLKLRPVDVAAFAGRADILDMLINNANEDPAKRRSNHHAWSILHIAVAGKSLETVEFVINKYKHMVDWMTDDNETAAVLAAETCCPRILKLILENGGRLFGENRKENLLDCATRKLAPMEDRVGTVLEIIKFCDNNGGISKLKKLMSNCIGGSERIMCKMVEQMPSVALEILNRCTETIHENNDLENVSTQTTWYHFFPLQNSENGDQTLPSIQKMIDNKCHDCLGHEVVLKFICMKWNSNTTALWYYVNILLYLTFLISTTACSILQTYGSYGLTSPGFIALSVISLVVILFNCLKEIVQIYFGWREYLHDLNNYVEWVMYISATIYLLPIGKEKTKIQIEAGAIAIFIAWINFIWFFKRQSLFGIYIIMAKKIFISLLKVLPMIILFIFAFSMAFFILLSSDDIGYNGMFISMLTTSVMMSGEVDYRSVFLETSGRPRPHIYLERVFLVLFLLIIIIVIMNLLVGLAVGDTDETMKRSKAEKRFYKASLIVALQRSLLNMHFNGLSPVKDPLEVNKENIEKSSYLFARAWQAISSETEVSDDDNDDDETNVIKSKIERLELSNKRVQACVTESFEDAKKQVKQVKETLDHVTTMLEKITQMNMPNQ